MEKNHDRRIFSLFEISWNSVLVFVSKSYEEKRSKDFKKMDSFLYGVLERGIAFEKKKTG